MKNVLIMLNLLKNGDYCKNPSLSNLGTNIDFKENGGKKAYPAKPRHPNHVSQHELQVYATQSQKA